MLLPAPFRVGKNSLDGAGIARCKRRERHVLFVAELLENRFEFGHISRRRLLVRSVYACNTLVAQKARYGLIRSNHSFFDKRCRIVLHA